VSERSLYSMHSMSSSPGTIGRLNRMMDAPLDETTELAPVCVVLMHEAQLEALRNALYKFST